LGYLNTNMTINNVFTCNTEFFGGTEQMAKKFYENVLPLVPNFSNYNCIIMPGQLHTDDINFYIFNNKEMIVWLHLLPNQLTGNFGNWLCNKNFTDKIKYIVVVSEFAKEDLIKRTEIDPKKIIVIYNIVEPINKNTEKFKNVKEVEIIHTPSLDRGSRLLLLSLKYAKEDFKLRIYNDLDSDLNFEYKEIKDILKDDRVYCHKRTTRKVLKESLSKSHIFVYPSIFEETFCISQAEALSADCLVIYNDIGALKEISSGYGVSYDGKINAEKHAKKLAELIDGAVKQIKSNQYDPGLQSEIINNKFSLENFKNSWLNLYRLV